jgi:solute carrier family 25 (mitochondrial S-adenosylmethionine transporter), member 26
MRPTLMTMRSSASSSSTKNTSKSPNRERRRGTRNNGRVLNKSNNENFGKKRSQRRSHNNFGDSDDDVIQISDEAEPITSSRRSKEDNKEDKEDKTLFEERLKTTVISICAAVSISSAFCVDPALAGFGAPTGAVLSPPVNTIRMDKLEKMNDEAKKRLSGITTTGNIDILLQELNELQQLDTKELDDMDAERALLMANSVKENLDTFSESEKASEMNEQKMRLLNKRKEEAELVQRLVDRRVALGKLNNQTPLIVYGSALAASLIANTTMHPVDTMKVRRITLKSRRNIEERDSMDELDNNINRGSGGRGGEASTSMSFDDSGVATMQAPTATATAGKIQEQKPYEPTMNEIMGEGGFMSLYDGLGPNLAKEGVPLTLYLGVYETVKLSLLDNTAFFNEHVILCYLLAGGCGEFIASIIRVPAEAVKSRTQTGATIPEAIQSNFKSARGRENIFKTWTVAVVRDIPFGAIQIALFESLKLVLTSQEHAPFDPNSLLGEAILGACGGIAGSLSVTPLDVVVTRLIQQMESADAAQDSILMSQEEGEAMTPAMERNSNVDGPFEMVQKIYAEGGAGAFWSGAQERVLYWGPAVAIFLSAYCRIRQSFL